MTIVCSLMEASLTRINSFRSFISIPEAQKIKLTDLQLFRYSLCIQFNVVLVTGTWLTNNDYVPNFKNYKAETLHRNDKKGGGVAIYLKQNLPFHTIGEL